MPSPRGVAAKLAALSVLAGAIASAQPARADDPSAPPTPEPVAAILDRVAVRFYAPEAGGNQRPRFITERTLSFEARLIAMSEQSASPEAPPQDRHLRTALERHVAEELLSLLGIEGGKDPPDLSRLADDARAELEARVGGEGPLRLAAQVEHIDPEEVESFFLRHARAEYYLDRNVAPLLSPPEDQLREVFRTSAHPFRGKHFDDVRKEFSLWFIAERVKAAESTFLQTARTRVKIVTVGH
jgi:hypothetical protein